MLLLPEQGLGDAIHFIRYAPLVCALGYKVSVLTHAPLKSLFREQSWLENVYEPGEARPNFDEYCPLLSLPLVLHQGEAPAQGNGAYLEPSPARREWASTLLGKERKPRVGLVWSGSPLHPNNARRSLDLAAFCPLLGESSLNFIALQKEWSAADRQACKRVPLLRDLSGDLRDFADTAAVIRELDLVITVDTAVAHLAGALGVPVWILLPFAADWRWRLARKDSPLYPSARLYRQNSPGDWSGVLAEISRDLAAQDRGPFSTRSTGTAPG
jgi:hypothetical protein